MGRTPAMRTPLPAQALLLLALPLLGTPAAGVNFVVLFMDDAGWGDFGCNNASVKETPHIDALAAKGIRFVDFHVAASVCTPSRAGLLTGRYGARTGVTTNFGPASFDGMAKSELTMGDILGAGGYDTHMIGKWHLGHHAGYHPTYRGFSTWFGLPYSGDMGCLDTTPQGCKPGTDRTHGQPACPMLCNTTRPSCAIPLFDSAGPNCSGHACDRDIAQQPFNPMTLSEQYTQRAKSILADYGRGGSKAGRKFLLYVAFAHTHTPHGYNPRWQNASARPGYRKVFGNALAEADWSIGSIVAALGDLGLEEETLVWLTADNGPADLGSVDCDAIGSPGPYTGDWQRDPNGGKGGATLKTQTWEGGHREVGVAYWKGHTSPRVTTALASTLDLVPTFAALAGVPLPADRHFDGVDLSGVLRNGSDSGHEFLFHPDGGGNLNAMRYGDYKLFFKTQGTKGCFRHDGSHETPGPPMQHDPPLVFDVTKDPGESTPIVLPAGTLSRAVAAHKAKLEDIASSFASHTNYSSGGPAEWPCCNRASPSCSCHE